MVMVSVILSMYHEEPAAQALVQPHARFHFPEGEGHAVDLKREMADAFFLDKKNLLLEAQLSPQADAATEPDFDLVTEGKVHAARQFHGGQAAARKPFGVALALSRRLEIQLALHIRRVIPSGRRDQLQKSEEAEWV